VFADVSDPPAQTNAVLPPLLVLVVNWNGRELLADCLGSVLENRYPALEVVMVDNGSQDDSVSFVRENYPTVEVIAAAENLRWAAGNNLVLRDLIAAGERDRHVLLLNNDTIVPGGSLQRLVAALIAEPSAWAATPRICYAHDPARAWYDGGRVGKFSGWIQHDGIRQLTGKLPAESRFVEYGTGCALLLSPQALHQVGDLDERFYFYGEDTDYSLRIRAIGGKILHVPRALVLHKVSAALGQESPQKTYLRSRSHIKLLQRHWPRSRLALLAFCQVGYYGGLMAWHLWGGRWQTALAAFEGVIDELRGAGNDSIGC